MGASAGGVEALTRLFSVLPADLDAAVAVTMHRGRSHGSVLASVVGRKASISIADAADGELFERRRIYLAPPDHHLLFGGGRLWLDRGAKHHHNRPAIDPMFTSAADVYKARAIGVLLTGHLSDGVTGLIEIKRRGGVCVVQDPQEAPAPSMPRNALRNGHVDLVFRLEALPALLDILIAGKTLRAAAAIPGVRAPSPEDLLKSWPD